MGLRTIEQADDSFVNNNKVDADFYLDIGEALLDIVIGIDPVTGFGRDAYELFTGKNLINRRDLTIFERGMSFYGVASFGIGSTMKGISNAILKLGRRFSNFIPGKYLESLPDAIKSGTKLALNFNADNVISIRKLKQSTKEETFPLLNSAIRIPQERMAKVVKLHTGIPNYIKSKFNHGEDISSLIISGTQQPMVRQPNGKYARIWDVGRPIGTDRKTGQQTSIMTVITNLNGKLITAFPGPP